MKRWNKVLALVMVAVMAVAMAGCGKKSDKYLIATDTTFAPFEFENESGDMVGIDLDLLAAIAEDQGFEYELQVLGFSAAVTALEAGQMQLLPV